MKNLKGTFTALITPFRNGKIDYISLEKLIAHQLKNGIDGFVVNGTTGESPSLSGAEIEELFKFFKTNTPDKTTLILGTGSNNTSTTIASTKKAEELGADAVLVVVPYYNKPPQRGLVAHFSEVAKSTTLPVILYNVPGRTITNLSTESTAELCKTHKNIVAIKDATGDIELLKNNMSVCAKDFIQLSGDDGSYVEFLINGGSGVISVASHVIPDVMVYWKKLVKEGKIEEARASIEKYKKLIDLLFCEANPIPVKMAMHLMGLIESPDLRLPLMTLSEKCTQELRQEMIKLGLI